MFRNPYVINITDHASMRLRGRLKLRGNSAEKTVFKAYREGIDSNSAKGQLASYIREQNSKYEGNFSTKVYNEFLWVFTREDAKGRTHRTENRESIINLVTVIPVPGEISKKYNKQKERNSRRVNFYRTTDEAMLLAGLA